MSELKRVPKLTGSDTEFANFITSREASTGMTDAYASRLLLSQIHGLPLTSPYLISPYGGPTYAAKYGSAANPQDRNRQYSAVNGGCWYIDLNHLEGCTPEVRSAREHEAAWGAALRIARRAQADVNAHLPEAQRIVVLANNSDRSGHSYGGHLSFLMDRGAWRDMLETRMYPNAFFLMAYQASSIVFTGQGKVGSENSARGVDYQISQRADFIETLVSEQTTYNRPLVNTRNEPLCGSPRLVSGAPDADRYARLHVIFYDTNLAPVATYLKVGVLQIVLTLIEAGLATERLVLRDPLEALHTWSHDPDLNARMPILSGDRLTAVQLQLEFLALAKRAAVDGLFDGIVPDAADILALWEDTLRKLHSRSFDEVRGRIDWLMKRNLLEAVLRTHPDCGWQSPEIVHMDQIYSSVDPSDSLFYALVAAGVVEPVSASQDIDRCLTAPPASTRAWLRTMLLRAVGPARVLSVDWDEIRYSPEDPRMAPVRIEMADPLGGATAELESNFAEARDLADLVARLSACGAISVTPQVLKPVATAVSLLDRPGGISLN